MTSAALLAATSKAEGKTSLQVLSKGRVGQIFVDATHTGDLRGYIKNARLDLPLALGEPPEGRRRVGSLVHPGSLSVVRRRPNGDYYQSMTPLLNGEVDDDLRYFIERSDQIPSVMVADTLVDAHGRVVRSGGVLVQALPDGDRDELRQIGERLADGRFARILRNAEIDDLLEALQSDAEPIDADLPLRWHCPCSRERAVNAVRLMGANEIAKMVIEDDPVTVDCDFCLARYEIDVDELGRMMADTTVAKA